MAGNYPDAPNHRMLLDRDGTVGFRLLNTNVVEMLTVDEVKQLNGDTDGAVNGLGTARWGYVFPELRDVTACFISSWDSGNGGNAVETSPDTTNGLDGVWTTREPPPCPSPVIPNYRTKISAITGAGAIRGIRFGMRHYTARAAHVYGTITAGQNPDRLEFWDPALNQRVSAAWFDWGNAPRVSSATKTFRIKNQSVTKTAGNIVVSIDALTDTIPSTIGEYTLSADAITFTPTVTVATIAPAGISGVLTIKRVTPVDAVLSLWADRVNAVPTTFA